jgi:hypothetical protein
MDNFYSNCPARMDDGHFLTNYKTASSYNEYIKFMNGIVRDDDYRLFLQLNADKIMDSEWLYLKKNDSCWNNACVHKYNTRMDPRFFVQERDDANLLFRTNELPKRLNCPRFADYRLTTTTMQNYQVSPNTCNSGKCNQ